MRLSLLSGVMLLVQAPDLQAQAGLDPLDAALVAYFQADSAEVRAEIAARVAAVPGATSDLVAERLHGLPLWLPAKPGVSSFDFDTPASGPHLAWVRIPPGYDPARAWPVLIALHGTNGRAKDMLAFAVGLLGGQADRMIVAAPQGAPNTPEHPETEADVNQPVRLLRALRRRYHLDSDRVFLTGYSLGGHRTCAAAVMYADQLAGVMPLAGSMMPIPGREEVTPYFLGNLQHLPMLMVWGELDTKGLDGREAKGGGIAGRNRRFAEAARKWGLPVTAVELPGVGHGGARPAPEKLEALLAAERPRYPSRVSHCFRYPGQGRAYWLRLAEFVGQPLGEDRVQVRLRPGEDAREALRRAIRNRLCKLEGTVDEQLITVRSKRAKVLEVLLHDEMVDLDQPVTIKMNGRRAFTGMLQRRVETLLELAAEDWDFDRVFPVRVRIAVGRRGRQR